MKQVIKKFADATTWGNSKACFALEKVLIEIGDEKAVKIANKYIGEFSTRLRAISELKQPHRGWLASMIRKHYESLIKNNDKFPEKAESFLLNILAMQTRKCIKKEK
jgi:hypothetical protein